MFDAIVTLIWVICGTLAYAGTLGHFQRKYHMIAHETYKADLGLAIVAGLMGPGGLIAVSILSGGFKYGFQWK